MAPSARHRVAEARFRELLRSAGIAEPDGVEYDTDELVFFWEQPKAAVVVELDPPAAAGPFA